MRTMTATHLLLLLAAVPFAVGCSDRGLTAQQPGYLSSDPCAQHTDQSSCLATARGCRWAEVAQTQPCAPCPEGAKCAVDCAAPVALGACVSNDPCLARDEAACRADSGCAWSSVALLCPIGAACSGGGFCHAKDDGGGDCACVSPVACPTGAECPKVECDCSGGGGGGACSCACPPCAPGEMCPPCACDCNDGGPGCSDPGTCACACPDCGPDASCAPCDCTCSGGGAPVGVVSSGGSDPASCFQYKDAQTCTAHAGCGIAPGPGGIFVCAGAKAPAQPCACYGPPCAPDSVGCDCACDCGTGGGETMKGCVPPPLPSPPPDLKPCPAIACAADCANGQKKDANGCDTCVCL